MAIIATVRQPDADFPQQTYVEATRLTNRFPTPPIAWGFCGVPESEEDIWVIDGLDVPYLIMGGPLHPEGAYVEPTLGQIWPRIG